MLDFHKSPVSWFLVLGFLHYVRGEFPDDVSGPTAATETSSGNSPRTPCKNPKTKNWYIFHGESLKSRTSQLSDLAHCSSQNAQIAVPLNIRYINVSGFLKEKKPLVSYILSAKQYAAAFVTFFSPGSLRAFQLARTANMLYALTCRRMTSLCTSQTLERLDVASSVGGFASGQHISQCARMLCP